MNFWRTIIKSVAILAACLMLSSCVFNECFETSSAEQDFKNHYYDRAFKKLLLVAHKGNPRAQYALGYMYYYGYGTPIDQDLARIWFKYAAANCYPPAVQAYRQITNPESQQSVSFHDGPVRSLQNYKRFYSKDAAAPTQLKVNSVDPKSKKPENKVTDYNKKNKTINTQALAAEEKIQKSEIKAISTEEKVLAVEAKLRAVEAKLKIAEKNANAEAKVNRRAKATTLARKPGAKPKGKVSEKPVVKKAAIKSSLRNNATPVAARSVSKAAGSKNAMRVAKKSGTKLRIKATALAAKGKIKANATVKGVIVLDKVATPVNSMTTLRPSVAEVTLIENILTTAWQTSAQAGLLEKTTLENQSRAITK
jgi:hypothetical protein